MSRTTSPCMGCGDRRMGCHGGCEKYQAWRQILDDQNAARMASRPAIKELPNRAWAAHVRKLRSGRR